MNKIKLENYKTDSYYPRMVRAVSAMLAHSDFIAPVELFKEMGLLREEDLKNWRHGRVPYLEKVIRCNLSAASRVLRILSMHAHDLNLRPSMTVYNRWGKGPKAPLRFTKTNAKCIEEAYSRHFVRLGKKETKLPNNSEDADAEQNPADEALRG